MEMDDVTDPSSRAAIRNLEGQRKEAATIIKGAQAKRTVELARAGEVLESVFSGIDILIAYLDNDLKYIRVNRAYAQVEGRPQDFFPGKSLFALFPNRRNETIFRRVIETGEPFYTYGEPFEHPDHPERGTTYWDWSVVPVKEPDGRVNGIILSQFDVTARVQAEEQAISEHAFRHAVEDCLLIGILAVDLQGKHIYANRAFSAMTGWQDEELLGTTPPFMYWPPEERKAIDAAFRKVLAGECPPEGFEVRFMRRNGERFDAHLLVSPLTDARGNPAGWVASVGNITRRKRDEAALRESAGHLRHLSYQLLSVEEKERKRISQELHDSIGQTLSAVKYGIEKTIHQVQGGAQSPQVIDLLAETVSMIRGAIDEVRSIISDLRPTILDDLGIIATIRWMCREYERMHEGIRIRKEIRLQEAEVPPHLKIVIYRILQESLNNVAKHSGADRVRLSLKQKDNSLELLLVDNGEGFDSAIASHGVGLTSMRERVELSGGTLTVGPGTKGGTVLRAVWQPLEFSL